MSSRVVEEFWEMFDANPIRLSEGVKQADIEYYKACNVELSINNFGGLIPDLVPFGGYSLLQGDIKRALQVTGGRDSYGRRQEASGFCHRVYDVAFPNWLDTTNANRRRSTTGYRTDWKKKFTPLGAKLVLKYLAHFGTERYVTSKADLTKLTEFAHSFDQEIEKKKLEPVKKEKVKMPILSEKELSDEYRLARRRKYQQQLRKVMLSLNPLCPLTGIGQHDLLIMSHIKPHSHCKDSPRHAVDRANVLMLSPAADHLFDLGYISFDDEGRLMRSYEISGSIFHAFGFKHDASIAELLRGNQGARRKKYLAHHRKFVFKSYNKEEWNG